MTIFILFGGIIMDTRTTVISIIILAVLAAFIIVRIFMNKDKDKAKDEAIAFLNSLADKFEVVILRNIKNIDFKHLDNLSEIEKKILDETIDELWTIVQDQLTSYVTKESTKELIRTIIDKEFLLNFITNFFNKDKNIQEVYTAKYNEALADKLADAEKFEQEAVKMNFEYSTEDLSKIEKVVRVDDKKEHPLNPQSDISDEELTYSTEDSSIEVVEEDSAQSDLQKEIEKQD
jgi:type II secretory pathway pseudopilin PulG